MSQAEDNKQVAEDFFLKAINEQNFDVLARILSPMYTYNGDPSSLEANKEWIIGLHSTYPGLVFAIEDIVGEDDKVALRWRMTAPAAGPRPAGWSTGTNIAHIEDGQIVSNFQNGQVSDSWTPAPAAPTQAPAAPTQAPAATS